MEDSIFQCKKLFSEELSLDDTRHWQTGTIEVLK